MDIGAPNYVVRMDPPPPEPDAGPQPPPAVHQSDADEDDESVRQLKECASLYLSLQDCLVNSNRNWKSCQMEVQALKECNERRKTDRRK